MEAMSEQHLAVKPGQATHGIERHIPLRGFERLVGAHAEKAVVSLCDRIDRHADDEGVVDPRSRYPWYVSLLNHSGETRSLSRHAR